MAPEQETQEELMERVKNMSPEELQEFQKSRCVFCQIIAGKIPAKKVYEDDKVLAILDINPAAPGHVLIMPKEHYGIMPQVPPDILEHLFIVAKNLSHDALKGLGAKGSNILIQNGAAAGQKSQHFMLHLIPRNEGDNALPKLEKKSISDGEYNTIRDRLRKRVYEIFEEPLPNFEAEKKAQAIEEQNKELEATNASLSTDKPVTEHRKETQDTSGEETPVLSEEDIEEELKKASIPSSQMHAEPEVKEAEVLSEVDFREEDPQEKETQTPKSGEANDIEKLLEETVEDGSESTDSTEQPEEKDIFSEEESTEQVVEEHKEDLPPEQPIEEQQTSDEEVADQPQAKPEQEEEEEFHKLSGPEPEETHSTKKKGINLDSISRLFGVGRK